MKTRKVLAAGLMSFVAPMLALAQITHGKPPKLPPPFTKPIEANPPHVKPTPGFTPTAPAGFRVMLFASGLNEPRNLAVAPNGDVFVAETDAGKVIVLSGPGHAAPSNRRFVFASGLDRPFGLAFHGGYVYVGDTNQVIRIPYDPRTSRPTGGRQPILALPGGGMHFTRTVVFSPDGKTMFVSVGSDCNVCVERDARRAAILRSNPGGKHESIYASGLRNAVGLCINPTSGRLWADVNERDMLGDNLPPDYFTSVQPGGFYGWPYSYIGKNLDPRIKAQRPDLVARAIIPDVLLGPHVAPLECTFYSGSQFPASYHDGAFIALHGSWNRSILNGYEVAFIPFRQGQPSGNPEPFLAGFDPNPKSNVVNGRPVGVAVARDGSLLVSDDGGNVIWRVSKAP